MHGCRTAITTTTVIAVGVAVVMVAGAPGRSKVADPRGIHASAWTLYSQASPGERRLLRFMVAVSHLLERQAKG